MLPRLDWDSKVLPHVQKIIQDGKQRGLPKHNLRGIFYILVSLNVIENLQQRYKGLSRWLAEKRRKGSIDPDAIADLSRSIIDIQDTFYSPEQVIDDYVEELQSLPDGYKTSSYLPRWYRQPYYVEVWIEKKTMAPVVDSILNQEHECQVRVVPTGGWSSFTYEYDNLKRLRQKQKEISYDERRRDIIILYLGDYDPSGRKMLVKMQQEYLRKYGIRLVPIAITKEQIQKWRLQHLTNPDPRVLAKLKKDANKADFMRDNNGQLFQIEVDVLQVLDPQILIDLLVSNVERYFNQSVYDKVREDRKFSAKYIHGLVRKKVKKELL